MYLPSCGGNMKRAAIYCRLSDEDRVKQTYDESESIQNQRSMLTTYAKERGWLVQDIYCDDDYSGADRKRPDFLRMLKACENGMVDIVLCKSQSRFSRDIELIEHYIHGKFIEWNVRFIGVVDNADTEIAENKKQRQVNALVNEWYLEDLSQNIRKTLRHKNSEGKSTAPFPPYGYLTDPINHNHFLLDEVAGVVVKRIFSLYTSGLGYIKIADLLNKENIPSPTVYKQTFTNYRNVNVEKSPTFGKWTASTVFRILRNEAYIGNLVQHKTENISYRNNKRRIVPAQERIKSVSTHEALIDIDTWEKVQDRQRMNTRIEKHTNGVSLFAGLVRCSECGGSMSKISYRSGKSRYNYYSCRAHNLKLCNNNRNIREDELVKAVLSEFNVLLDRYFDVDQIIASFNDNSAFGIEQKILEYNRKIEQKRAYLEQMYLDKLEGILTNEQYARLNTKITSELHIMEDLINGFRSKLINNENEENKRILSKYKKMDYLIRQVVIEFVEFITVSSVAANGLRKITIKWKF